MANNYTFPNNFSNGAQSSVQNNMNTMNNSLQQMQQMVQLQTQQQFFLQSQGNLYMINSPLEVSNVPVGVGLSAAISLSEGLLYLKTMQNGVPMVRYTGNDNRMREHLNRIYEGAEMYEYGRDRYQHGGNEERIYDGLEKLMYALCMFVESTMEFAETPQEKEIIRKHIQKLQKM